MTKKASKKAALKALSRLSKLIDRHQESDLQVDQLVATLMSCQPADSSSSYAFKWEYLQQEILSKYCDPQGSPRDREQKAIDKMLTANNRCKHFNDNGFPDLDSNILFRAQQIISSVLLDVDDLFADEFELHTTFTGGATVCRTRAFGDPYFKYDSNRALAVTNSAYPYAKLIIDATPLWVEPKINIVSGNSIFTVPKSSDIDRAASKEPGLNQMLQTGVGRYIRRRLKLHGIDLNDQSINRKLAREGSITGELATIDLKSASDSISSRCILELLPFRWVKLLDDLRSPCGTLPDGTSLNWEMLSSMGNGFTFELESLIFYAVVKAAVEASNLPASPSSSCVSV